MTATKNFTAGFFYPLIALLAMFAGGCGDSRPTDSAADTTPAFVGREKKDCAAMLKNARVMDSTLILAYETNDTVAAQAISAFTAFALYCDHDTMAPVYLIKSAQVARAVNKYATAKSSLEKCISEHREFADRPAAMFLLAQLYEDPSYMQSRDEAERLYRQVLDEYPESVWAENARAALAMVGKSEEEIIRMLKKGR